MSWYYASGGQQQGPVDDAQFEAMAQSGQIKPSDLVWREGMTNWQPLNTVRPASPVVPPTGAPPVIGGPTSNEVTCIECQGTFSKDNAIQYGSAWVCAACKPIFIQKLKEGAAVGAGPSVNANRFPMGPISAEELMSGVRNRGYDLDLGSCISRGWTLVTTNLGGSIGVTCILGLCMVALGVASWIPCLGSLLQLAVQGPLTAGFMCYFLKLIREKDAGIGDAFLGFSNGWLHLALFSLVSAIIMVLFIVPAIGVGVAIENRWMRESVPLLVALAVLGAVPIIVLSISWFFASPLIIDRGLDFWSAMEVSRKVIWMHWWQIVLLMIVVSALMLAGALAVCIGMLISIPFASATIAYAYEDIFNGPAPAPAA